MRTKTFYTVYNKIFLSRNWEKQQKLITNSTYLETLVLNLRSVPPIFMSVTIHDFAKLKIEEETFPLKCTFSLWNERLLKSIIAIFQNLKGT